MWKSLLGIKEMSKTEILSLLELSSSFENIMDRDIKKVPTLRGKVIVNLFFEPSTRTRTSFEIAGKILSADVINISPTGSSLQKGESIKDTVLTLKALGADFIVVRHSHAGVPYFISKTVKASIVNAGDGFNEHPTQALLDLYTIQKHKKNIEELCITIVGDIAHSRVARSNIYALTKLGAKVNLVAPPTMLPSGAEKLPVNIYYNLKEIAEETDVLYLLRLQLERQSSSFFPSLREYSHLYGISREKLKWFKKNILIMHPGPINRGVEIDAYVADSIDSLIKEQVRNGVVTRMAVLYHLAGREIKDEPAA